MTTSLAGLPVLIEVFWKSGAALGLALSICWLLRGKSADLRRLVLSTAILVIFVAAIASPVLPRWAILRSPVPVGFAAVPAPDFVDRAIPASTHTSTVSRAMPNRIDRAVPWIASIWLLGTLLLLARFSLGLLGLHRLRRASHPIVNFQDSDAITRRVTLLQNETLGAPVTWGLFRPVILVPAHFERLPLESRHAVLHHEMAHIQGHDFSMRILVEIARAALWFQPLIWLASRHLREEQELACDNRVLDAGGKPSAYAKLLLNWDVRPGSESLIAVGMAHRSCLKRRLRALLDQDVPRDQVAAKGVLAAGILGLAAALPLAAISMSPAIVPLPAIAPRLVYSAPIPVTVAVPQPPVRLARAKPAPQLSSTEAGLTLLPRFSTTVQLVIVDASVKDASGKPVEGLKSGDFVVTENDTPQAVSVFEFQKIDDLSSYYILGYYTSNEDPDGRYRKTKIALANQTTAKLDYRAGYYANKGFLAMDNKGKLFMVDGVTCGTCDTPVGPGPTFPVLTSQVKPEYAEQARKAKYSGMVTLNIEVDSSGNVTSARIVKSLGMGLDEKAVEAVTQWKFKPGTKDGKPVSVHALVDVNFALM